MMSCGGPTERETSILISKGKKGTKKAANEINCYNRGFQPFLRSHEPFLYNCKDLLI